MKTAKAAVKVPTELMVALEADAGAAAAFGVMPASHRAEYCRYVEEAKKAVTRSRRAKQSLQMIHAWAQDRRKVEAAAR